MSPYSLSGSNKLCSDTKNKTVKDQIECRKAFADILDDIKTLFPSESDVIQHSIDDSPDSSDYPSGCIVVVVPRGIVRRILEVRWNAVSDGNRHSSAYQVCRKGILQMQIKM